MWELLLEIPAMLFETVAERTRFGAGSDDSETDEPHPE